MLIYVIAVVVIIVIVVAAIVMAKGTARLDTAVQQNREAIDNMVVGEGYDVSQTLGFKIPLNADYETQVSEARKAAAKRAAALPRGANMGIGRLGHAQELKTAWKGVEHDPVTAVKIAAYHGWDGLRTGAVITAPAPAPAAKPAPAADGKISLVPGKDYPVIEITDDMSPADKRKARVANAKAKSAAMKAAKAKSGSSAAPAAAAPAAAPTVPEPKLIEITDDMSPEAKRKARIANSKAKSAYKKALKAAGVDPKAAATAPAASSPAEAVPAPSTEASVPPPTLVELTDDMSPEEKRAARIANAKAKSAYKKALKAAGIDPKTVKI